MAIKTKQTVDINGRAAPLKTLERVILGVDGLIMIKLGLVTDIAGIANFAAILFWQLKQNRQ